MESCRQALHFAGLEPQEESWLEHQGALILYALRMQTHPERQGADNIDTPIPVYDFEARANHSFRLRNINISQPLKVQTYGLRSRNTCFLLAVSKILPQSSIDLLPCEFVFNNLLSEAVGALERLSILKPNIGKC